MSWSRVLLALLILGGGGGTGLMQKLNVDGRGYEVKGERITQLTGLRGAKKLQRRIGFCTKAKHRHQLYKHRIKGLPPNAAPIATHNKCIIRPK